jgi:hypothetical protein
MADNEETNQPEEQPAPEEKEQTPDVEAYSDPPNPAGGGGFVGSDPPNPAGGGGFMADSDPPNPAGGGGK